MNMLCTLNVLFVSAVFSLLRHAICSLRHFEKKSDVYVADEQKLYIKNLFKEYEEYSFVIHTDNASLIRANSFLITTNKHMLKSYTIFNYDCLPTKMPRRPEGFRFLNVVLMADPNIFASYLKDLNVIIYDAVIYVINTEYFPAGIHNTFWKTKNLKFAGNVIILTLEKQKINVYRKCYYCGSDANKLKHLQTTSGAAVKINKKQLMPSDFLNLNGHFFKVAFLDYFPYMFCKTIKTKIIDKKETDACTQQFGSEAAVLEILSKKLNFTYRLLSDGNVFNKSYANVFMKVEQREVDFAIGGITKTADRVTRATFTKSIRFEEYMLLYVFQVPIDDKIFFLLYPFDFLTWIILNTIVATLIFGLYWFSKIIDGDKSWKITTTKCFFVCIRCFLEQTTHSNTNLFSFRTRYSLYLLLTVLGFASIEFAVVYKSKLSAIIIHPPYSEPKDLQDLLESKYEIVIESLKNDTVWEILNATDASVTEAKKHTAIRENICEVMDYVLNNKAAMLSEYAVAQYNWQYICSHFEDDPRAMKLIELLRIARTSLRSTQHGWPLQKGIPYWKSFNKIFGILENGGFTEKWKADAVAELKHFKNIPQSKDRTREPRKERVPIDSYLSPFVLYLSGNILGLICFLVEILTAKYLL